MAENQNRAEIARIVSDDVFGVFGWNREKPRDVDWPCPIGHHGDETFKTHPTDVVFWYEDPYSDRRIYFNTDLKSYAKNTITKAAVGGALRSMAAATHCANVSDEWRKLFATADANYQVAGLLFVYNHDGQYDAGFESLLESVDEKTVVIAKGTRVYVLSPERIAYVATVAQDIDRFRDKALGNGGTSNFFYPDLVRARPRSNSMPAASIETLLGPWIVLKYLTGDRKVGARLYYAGTGETVDEFKYLLDYLFRSELLYECASVTIHLTFPHKDALPNFERARDGYPTMFAPYGVNELKKRLGQLTCSTIAQQRLAFSPLEIGMTRG